MEFDVELLKAVRRTVGDQEAEIATIDCRTLGEGFADAMAGGDGLLFHSGTARTSRGEQDFQMVEKICRVLPTGRDPGSWLYWKREALAYESGFLDATWSGMRAPECFGVAYTDEPAARVFIEAVAEPQPDWNTRTFAQASHALGRFNATNIGMPDVNKHSWMAVGRAHSWTDAARVNLDSLDALKTDPVVSQWLAGSNFERTADLWRNIGRLRNALQDLPKCFCHHDAFKRNLLFRKDADSKTDIVAIDWAFAGHGVIGEELAAMVGASLTFLEFEPADADEMIDIIFSNYVRGLKDAGWKGSSSDVRLGFCATTAMIFALGALGPWLPLLQDPKMHRVVEEISGMTVDRFIANLAQIHHYFLDLGEEAVSVVSR